LVALSTYCKRQAKAPQSGASNYFLSIGIMDFKSRNIKKHGVPVL